MEYFMWVIVIASSIWVSYDFSKLSEKNNISKERKGFLSLPVTPVGWFLGCFLLWIIFFPLYLARREKYVKRPEPVNTPKICNNCRKYYEGKPQFCPNCGEKIYQGIPTS